MKKKNCFDYHRSYICVESKQIALIKLIVFFLDIVGRLASIERKLDMLIGKSQPAAGLAEDLLPNPLETAEQLRELNKSLHDDRRKQEMVTKNIQ